MQDFFRTVFENFREALTLLFENAKFADVIDVLIVTFLIYEVIILVRHTRAQNLAMGILVLVLSYAAASAAGLKTLTFVLQAVMNFGIVVLAVVFQPEIRRALEQVGNMNTGLTRLLRQGRVTNEDRAAWQKAIAAICDAADNMAEQKVGALIVLERSTNLVEIIRTGTPLHSDVNVEVLSTIFYEGTPLHDGAVVVRNARIEAAGCFLPLSNNLEVSKDMGTRHRSALGMSENSDAVVVVVSEESGIISLAKRGVMIRRLDRQNLYNLLMGEIVPAEPEPKKKGLFRRRKEEAPVEEQQ